MMLDASMYCQKGEEHVPTIAEHTGNERLKSVPSCDQLIISKFFFSPLFTNHWALKEVLFWVHQLWFFMAELNGFLAVALNP